MNKLKWCNVNIYKLGILKSFITKSYKKWNKNGRYWNEYPIECRSFVVRNVKIMGFYFGNKFFPVIYGNKILIWVTVFDSSYIYIYIYTHTMFKCISIYRHVYMWGVKGKQKYL